MSRRPFPPKGSRKTQRMRAELRRVREESMNAAKLDLLSDVVEAFISAVVFEGADNDFQEYVRNSGTSTFTEDWLDDARTLHLMAQALSKGNQRLMADLFGQLDESTQDALVIRAKTFCKHFQLEVDRGD